MTILSANDNVGNSYIFGFGHSYISVKISHFVEYHKGVFSSHLAKHRDLCGNCISDPWRVDCVNWQVVYWESRLQFCGETNNKTMLNLDKTLLRHAL